MTNTTNPETMTPAEIDTILGANWGEQARYGGYLASTRGSIIRAAKNGWERQLADAEAEEARLEAKLDTLKAEAAPFTAEFTRRGGWNRYFLVNNTGGHVHRGMNCNTCFATTQFNWLPSLSDCDEAEMVAEYGEMACTVCFPAAPTYKGFNDGTSALARYSEAQKAQRAAEKAAKQAAKDAKSISAPDGSPLKVDGDTIRTIIAAERKLSDVVQSYGWYGETHPSNFAAQAKTLTEALLARGTDAERINGIIARASKKAAKEGAGHLTVDFYVSTVSA